MAQLEGLKGSEGLGVGCRTHVVDELLLFGEHRWLFGAGVYPRSSVFARTRTSGRARNALMQAIAVQSDSVVIEHLEAALRQVLKPELLRA